MNNRKQSLGRKYGTRKKTLILGFTVAAKKIDEKGKSTKNTFSTFVPVEVGQNEVDQKLSTNHQKETKLYQVQLAINEAYGRAVSVAAHKDFECVIIKKSKNTDIAFNRW